MLQDVIGRRIRECRRRKGLTQEGLAQLLSLSHQVISKWENGLTMPDIQSLYTMAQIFHTTLDEMCGKKNRAEEIVEQVRQECPYPDEGDFQAFYQNWEIIQTQIRLHPTHEGLLIYGLQYLRQMHDSVWTEEEKERVNAWILSMAERILDISRQDDHRSLANYNLALYYSEQVHWADANPENQKNAQLARRYADRVLYKDMHPSFFHLFGCESIAESCKACETTWDDLTDALHRTLRNWIRYDDILGRSEEGAYLQKFADAWLRESKEIKEKCSGKNSSS